MDTPLRHVTQTLDPTDHRDEGPPPWYRSTRYFIAFISSFGMANTFLQRGDLSMAIVCMVNHTAVDILKYGHSVNDNATISTNDTTRYLYMGINTTSNIRFTSNATDDESPYRSCGTPTFDDNSQEREGFTIPGLFAVWGKWAPPTERSRLICITYSGNISATALVFPLSAFLCKVNFAGGWPSVFYLYGVLGLLWTFIWMFCMYDEPAHHPRIHPKELQYIEASLGRSTTKDVSVQIPTPWVDICTSLPFLAIVCAQVTYNWSIFLMMSNLPIYMKEVLRFDIKSNGVYSFIPYLAMFLVILLGSLCADALIEKQLLSVKYTRKLMTVIGHLVPGMLLIVLSYLDCTQSHIAVAVLTLAIGLGGLAFCGILVNFYDIAPVFATKIMTVSNAVSMIPGILVPYVVAEVTKDKTREQWQIVFFLTAGLLGIGTVVYLILGQGHVQKWAIIRDTPEEEIALPS
ncbi:putative inorganic phosphate cotransporter isoform X4 [Haliotis rufescens]|uniref:putative inorganic phosphate cotransporter isoform X4 n=1 Tax=Haliotis rufescens TaxID=6454 RepID=UPI00201ED2FB|nr:putative inorganic phosphate cotransporter isoform X4 [Haliotis rufescens]